MALLVFLWSPIHLLLPYSFPQLFHKISRASSILLGRSASILISSWVETLRGKLCQALDLKYNIDSLAVSGIISYSWVMSQVKPIMGWSFPQSLFHLYPCNSCRQDIFWGEGFMCGLVSLSLHWKSCLVSSVNISLIVGITARVLLIDCLKPPPFQVFDTSQKCSLTISLITCDLP